MEYAVLFALVAAALVGMRVFFTRAVQEKFRQSADVFGGGEQYSPGRTSTSGGGMSQGMSAGSASRSSGSGLSGGSSGEAGGTFDWHDWQEEVTEEVTEQETDCASLNATVNTANSQIGELNSNIADLDSQVVEMENYEAEFRQRAYIAYLFGTECSGEEWDEMADEFDVDPVSQNILGQNVYRKGDLYTAVADRLDASAADCRTRRAQLVAQRDALQQTVNSTSSGYPECF